MGVTADKGESQEDGSPEGGRGMHAGRYSGEWSTREGAASSSLPSRLSVEQALLWGERVMCGRGVLGRVEKCEIALAREWGEAKRLQAVLKEIRIWKCASLPGWGLIHLYLQPQRSCK